MTSLHSFFQTVMQWRIVTEFMIAALNEVRVTAVVIQMIVGVVYYIYYQILVSPAADSVVYNDGALRVRHHGQEVPAPVFSIVGIRGRLGTNPETVTRDLSESTAIGLSAIFIPLARLPSTKDHPMMAPCGS